MYTCSGTILYMSVLQFDGTYLVYVETVISSLQAKELLDMCRVETTQRPAFECFMSNFFYLQVVNLIKRADRKSVV